MSKIVEVNESQDLESSDRTKKNKQLDLLHSDSNNLQSMQSLAVVTDTDD